MIISCKDYNARQSVAYSKKCREWQPDQGGFPQVAFMFFHDKRGNTRENGFVKIEGGRHQWAKTKKELKEVVTDE